MTSEQLKAIEDRAQKCMTYDDFDLMADEVRRLTRENQAWEKAVDEHRNTSQNDSRDLRCQWKACDSIIARQRQLAEEPSNGQ